MVIRGGGGLYPPRDSIALPLTSLLCTLFWCFHCTCRQPVDSAEIFAGASGRPARTPSDHASHGSVRKAKKHEGDKITIR